MAQTTGISPSSSNSMPISAAENYQLKWNSHISNLNTNISSLYKNDKYADVMLFTCNTEEGFYGIPAHKLILGSCSHYFSSIFDNNPLPINTMIYIFLPPDLSKRAVATLIQYMYTGEATVSNDILNEVLKGGEILKIRGLCKINSGASKYSSPIEAVHQQPQQIHSTTSTNGNNTNSYPQSYKLIESGSSVNASPIKSNKSTPRNSIDKSSTIHPDTRNSSTVSHYHHVLSQNESPVVVMTSQSSQSAQPIALNGTNSQHQSGNLIIVKKDMAIDPGDTTGNIPVEHYGLISLKIAAAVKKAQQQNLTTSVKKSPSTSSGDHQRRTDFYQIDDALRYDTISSPTAFKVYTSENIQQIHQSQLIEDAQRYTEKKKRIVAQNQKPSSSSDCIRDNDKGQSFHLASSVVGSHEKHPHFPEALSFLTIKEEPIEWTEFDNNGLVGQAAENRGEGVTIKPENLEEVERGISSEGSENKVYSPLTCEVCNLKFQVPSAWVRHIESHSELNQAQPSVPKKRKKVDEEENSENINVLSCDLCENMSFATPAQWVRHVQNTHTETELAMSNNSILLKKTNIKQPKESPLEKPAICSICKKAFPTYASMLIHKRSHSEEKPFTCQQPNCSRGFNIKSNLIRHMRTCHPNQMPSGDNQDSDNVE